MNKKTVKTAVMVIIAAVLVFLFAITLNSGHRATKEKQAVKIAVSMYRSDDPFVRDIVNSIEESAKEFEQYSGKKVTLDISSAKNNQKVQNEQIKRYIDLKYDVICVNIVDRTTASVIIDAAVDADIPLIFFNREPVDEDIKRGDDVYYVGMDAKATGIAQGEILADYIVDNFEKVDKNGDGIIQYGMLEGEMEHQDSFIRTEWSVTTLNRRDIKLEKVQSSIANWERGQAAATVEQWLKTDGSRIEVIICNNDEMAIGAIESLKKAGIKRIPVMGIDATAAGRKAIAKGDMLGTVSCNGPLQGKIIFKMARALAFETPFTSDIELINDHYITVPIEKVF